jgi:hypothetical protein
LREKPSLQSSFGSFIERESMSKVIEFLISPTGETKIQTKGFSGSECSLASKPYETALGLKTSDVKSAEFYGTSDAQVITETKS